MSDFDTQHLGRPAAYPLQVVATLNAGMYPPEDADDDGDVVFLEESHLDRMVVVTVAPGLDVQDAIRLLRKAADFFERRADRGAQ